MRGVKFAFGNLIFLVGSLFAGAAVLAVILLEAYLLLINRPLGITVVVCGTLIGIKALFFRRRKPLIYTAYNRTHKTEPIDFLQFGAH